MTNSPKSDSDLKKEELSFDGITFEVEEEEQTHEGQKVKRRGIYLWPNLITTAALLSGFYSIIASMNGNFTQAIYAIFLAALLDGLDGRVARAIGAQSAFGEQYDSLSDLLAFGVARLARFNVQIGVVDKRYFIGIASPLAAVTVISMVWVSQDYPLVFDLNDITIQIINAVIMVSIGLLMISNIKYYSFKQMDRKRVPFVVMLPVVLIFAAITYNIPVGILVVCIIYVLSGFVTTLLAKKMIPK